MRNFNIDFAKSFKKVLIVYLAIFLIGAIMTFVFGVDLDINFKGGAKISYTYSGQISEDKIEASAKKVLDKKFNVSKSTGLAGDTKSFEITLAGKNSLSTAKQEKLTETLKLFANISHFVLKINLIDSIPPSRLRRDTSL